MAYYFTNLPEAPEAPARRRGFTLIEILIVVLILGLLAAIVVAQVGNLVGMGRSEALAGSVLHVRNQIEYRAATADGPLSPGGYPVDIDADWFPRDELPQHTWTQLPMMVEVVAGAGVDVFPPDKTFDSGDPAAPNAWYNTTNGAFAVRVGAFDTEAEVIEALNMANNARIAGVGQTTY